MVQLLLYIFAYKGQITYVEVIRVDNKNKRNQNRNNNARNNNDNNINNEFNEENVNVEFAAENDAQDLINNDKRNRNDNC